MQSVSGALAAHKHDRHFADPSVGWANFPPEKAAGVSAGGSIKQLPASPSDVDQIWRAVPWGTARLTAFISVSARHLRTPMNSPLRSARPEKRPREAGFDEGCSLN
ncbi:hypothetical protein LJ656_15175 [Paraburkholderia sp. MMS20-SJTR3]|uniref:Uncharacterized protein n=1 Tax=Paraburkholderia sejongensis TaxID=2886946 RepID=A0ABS8JVL1_9BURK|nr:hypothetical protein [Paraburkholderia sp. MMS20-SJTR3]MCC8393937.1 hypothetical protein [Paraburkholderia sp. MMS20-SJTR3]